MPEALAARFLAFFAAFLAARFWAFLAAFLDFFEVTSSSSEAHVSGPTTPVLGIACLRWYFLTAFRVAGPKYPERGVTLSTFWTRFTAECCMPEVRIGWVSARAGAVGASRAQVATPTMAMRLIRGLPESFRCIGSSFPKVKRHACNFT